MRFALFLLFALSFEKLAIASDEKCNINKQCLTGKVCIGGTPANITDDGTYNEYETYTGACVPIMPMRQLCFLYNIMTGVFGKALVALVIISVGVSFMFGKIDYKHLITLAVGIICIFGAYQVLSLFMGNHFSSICDGIDYLDRIGNLVDDVYEDLTEDRIENNRIW